MERLPRGCPGADIARMCHPRHGVGFLLGLTACGPVGRHPAPAPAALSRAESVYAVTLTLKDRVDILTWRERLDSIPVLRARYLAARSELGRALAIDSLALADTVDRRALAVMRRTVRESLTDEPEPPDGPAAVDRVRCTYDPRALTDTDSLQSRLYDCYGAATRDVVVDGERLDRLTVFALLGVTADAARRRRLFLGLDRVWRSVNGANESASPWRELLRRRAREWGTGPTPFARRVSELGFVPDSVERWLVRLLEAWRATLPDSSLEPWDLYYAMGAASRRLSPRITRDSLLALNGRFYRDLGADPAVIGVHYDIEPRAGKDPVAFTTFGARPGFTRGAWQPGEPWVFASYAVGGLDNLGELLHETGHAIHIAGIRTRPAFSDWPDADLFTEAIADLADGEAYDGRWQVKYLGDSAPPAENRRTAYFGVMMDACWSLFEARMQREPDLDPNVVWTELTSRYLRVVPHPELSWWAMRGQLIDVPGYLVNYALGAFIAADLRARIRQVHGAFTLGDSTWYGFVRERIYRYGLERSSRRVMEAFLGRPVSAEALLSSVRRGLSAGTGGPAN